MNEHEARARAAKAAKIARVCRSMMEVAPEIGPRDFLDATEDERARIESVAQVNPASLETWRTVVTILEATPVDP